MRQIVQSYQTGELRIAEVPAPALLQDTLLVRTASSLISIGTEQYMIRLAKKSLLGKAMARPDLVRQVWKKVVAEGPTEAYRQAKGRLDAPVPLGYSAAGEVIAVGDRVAGFSVGDRIACAGSNVACHAELLRVPGNLAASIPSGVDYDSASFVALGGIALHALRMAEISLGERVAIIGLGLLGQIAVQIAAAAGCRVIGFDVDPMKAELARRRGATAVQLGQDAAEAAAMAFSEGRGVDAVVIFASTESNEPVMLAAEIARERGRIVVPGLVGLDLPRKLFYEKELNFVVSRAWGPGMYDPEFEAGRVSYPRSLVPWTAQRNIEHFLELLRSRAVSVDDLVTHRFGFDAALDAYARILDGSLPSIGVVLKYPDGCDISRTVRRTLPERAAAKSGDIRVGLIGGGQFARGTLLPALQRVPGVRLTSIATLGGLTGEHFARRFGLARCTTDPEELLRDPEVDLVMILTRHDSHARLGAAALRAGKDVFLEKPLAIDLEQLRLLAEARKESQGRLMVGFNRRFAPTTEFLGQRLSRVPRPLILNMRVNVGPIPATSWVHDPAVGGGNLVGEACHFFDLAIGLTKARIVSVYARPAKGEGAAVIGSDNLVVTFGLTDGSVGTLLYTTLGDRAVPRERIEVFGGGAVGVIDNFKSAEWTQNGRRSAFGGRWSGVDRGHEAELQALIRALRAGLPPPVPFEDYVNTTVASLAAEESLRTSRPVEMASFSSRFNP